MDRQSDNDERIASATILLAVVAFQLLTAISSSIRRSAGRSGRFVYYVAFFLNIVHELFVGLVVPGSLIWAAVELLAGTRGTDALLAAVVGSLWYGPERVQTAIVNLLRIRRRARILRAALGEYHRAAVETDVEDRDLHGHPLTVKRRLRFMPWWSNEESSAEEYWNGKVMHKDYTANLVRLSDGQLRTVAREGVDIALQGEFDENRLRVWCARIVADQARFPNSLLEETREYSNLKVLEGVEGKLIKEGFELYGKEWKNDELLRLASVANGIRKNGLDFIREDGWIS